MEVKNQALVAGAVLIFGVNYPVLKYVLGMINPHAANAIRMGLGFLLLLGVYLWQTPRAFRRFGRTMRTHWRGIVLVGIVGYYLSPVCYLVGMEQSSASNASIIIASAPIWTVLFSWLLNLDRLSGSGWMALVLSMAGALLVGVLPRNGIPPRQMLVGNGFLLLDALLWGLFIVLNKRLMLKLPPLEATVWSIMVALPALIVTALAVSSPASLAQPGPLLLVLALLFSGLLSMGIGQLWWNTAIDGLGPARAGIYGNGIPVVGLASSVLLLGEPLTTTKIVGISLVLFGVYLLRRDPRVELTPVPGKPPVA